MSTPYSISFNQNKISKFEQSLPFVRISIEEMFRRIQMAEDMEKESNAEAEDVVTLDSLAQVLNSPAWQPLQDPESVVAKLLTSDAFKKDDTYIDVHALKLFSIFHCQGKSR